MKKLLLLLALVLSCGLASFAETAVFYVGTAPEGTTYKTELSGTVANTTVTAGDVKAQFIKKNTNSSSYVTLGLVRFYANDEIVISAAEEGSEILITKIVVNCSETKYAKMSVKSPSGSTFTAGPKQEWTSADGVNSVTLSNTAQSRFSYLEVTYTIASGDDRKPAGLEYTTKEFNVELDNEFTAPELVNPNDLAVTYTSSDESVATVAADGSVEILAAGTTTITAKSLETKKFKAGEASYVLKVTKPIPEGAIVEELTATNFGIGASYKDYTWTSPVTNIKYIAHAYSQTSGQHFQLRTKESKSGIVVAENVDGYIIREVRIEWTDPTTVTGTTLDVYVNDEAYSAPSALFSSATQGNKVGSIVKAENAPLSLNADKKFVGIRSNNGAVQLSKITLVWEKPAAPVAPAAPVVTMGEKTVTVTVEEGCTAYYKFVVVNDQPAIETFALEADTWYPVENNTIDLTKLPMTSGNEKLQLTVKAVNADNVESEVYTTEPFANPGGTTGIADIELGEEAPAEYYNLQGVRMEGELTPGLYIRRQGNKATKVIVK